MGKETNPRRVAENEARAKLRMIRISPQKLNLVAAMIRGKKVERALNDLAFHAIALLAHVPAVEFHRGRGEVPGENGDAFGQVARLGLVGHRSL